jgi:hypothetical protein
MHASRGAGVEGCPCSLCTHLPRPVYTVCFYDDEGNLERTFDYSGESDVKEFGCAVVSPSSVAVVVGNYNRFITYAFNSKSGEWEESKTTMVPHLYNVTALGWKADGRCVLRCVVLLCWRCFLCSCLSSVCLLHVR